MMKLWMLVNVVWLHCSRTELLLIEKTTVSLALPFVNQTCASSGLWPGTWSFFIWRAIVVQEILVLTYCLVWRISHSGWVLGFDHFQVGISVCVQKMARADLASAGVAFSLDTESGFDKVDHKFNIARFSGWSVPGLYRSSTSLESGVLARTSFKEMLILTR